MPASPFARSCLYFFLLALPAVAAAADVKVAGRERIESRTLANGMKLIVWPDNDIPNIVIYNWVRVGSRNEAPGITGLAHFFEHMMFNGTSRRAPGEFDRVMEANGGANNAYTTDDVTVYQDWIPRGTLETVFDLESDRLAHLSFDPKVVESERNVVYSERRLRVEDNTTGQLAEQVQATAFAAHPYHFPTIGWPSDIKGWQIDDLKNFFRTYYAPNNCTMVVVGDVSAAQVFDLANKYFEPIASQPPPQPIRTIEPEQLGEKRVTLQTEAQTPLLQFAYKAPAAGDARGPALDLLLAVLTDGDASRLHRALVERSKVAIDVSGYWQEGFDPGLLWFFLTLPSGADVAAAEAAFDGELSKVVSEGVSDEELRRAKNMALSGFWQGMATINGKARLLGQFEVMHGGYDKLFAAPADYERVTAAQLRELAAELFDARRRTVGVLQATQAQKEPT
ncbi:MAG: pitrilysin family protein [Steroidobacteraceae bacterium]